MNIDFGSADSVAYHLAGLIPLTSLEKQKLLEAFDATQRMENSRLIIFKEFQQA